MLAPTDMQESSLSHNEFALCLRSPLRPSSALSPCEFATCMRALIPSTVPACLRSLPGPSLALSPIEFESYMRALTPIPVSADFRQSDLRPGQPILPITGLTTRFFSPSSTVADPAPCFPSSPLVDNPARSRIF